MYNLHYNYLTLDNKTDKFNKKILNIDSGSISAIILCLRFTRLHLHLI